MNPTIWSQVKFLIASRNDLHGVAFGEAVLGSEHYFVFILSSAARYLWYTVLLEGLSKELLQTPILLERCASKLMVQTLK